MWVRFITDGDFGRKGIIGKKVNIQKTILDCEHCFEVKPKVLNNLLTKEDLKKEHHFFEEVRYVFSGDSAELVTK